MKWRFPILIVLVGYLFVGAISCKKSDPEPEKKDPLYLQTLEEEKAAAAERDAALLAVKEAEDSIKLAVPQTGQIKFAEKRFWDARNRLSHAEQHVKYLNIRAELQLRKTRVKSLTAFHSDKEWSNEDEHQAYQLQKKLNESPKSWSVKHRRAALGLSTGRNVDSVKVELPKAEPPAH